MREVEGPRRCLLADAFPSFPTTNYKPNQKSHKLRAEPRDLQFYPLPIMDVPRSTETPISETERTAPDAQIDEGADGDPVCGDVPNGEHPSQQQNPGKREPVGV